MNNFCALFSNRFRVALTNGFRFGSSQKAGANLWQFWFFLLLSASLSLSAQAANDIATWGQGPSGNGDGPMESSNVPILVKKEGVLAGKNVIAVAAGGFHRLALCSDGSVAAWSRGYFPGILGDGLNDESFVPVLVKRDGVLAGKTVIAISAGSNYSLALCSDGNVVGWGNNSGGQLGNGTNKDSNVPVLVKRDGVLAGKTVVTITAGSAHSLALCSDGTLVAWGGNSNGELGNGTNQHNNTPVLVKRDGVLSGKTVIAIDANSGSFALCSDGTLASWGKTFTFTDSSDVPVLVKQDGALAGKTIIAISAGYDHNLALCSDGTIAASGSNLAGQLGNGTTEASNVPVLVKRDGILSGKTVVAIDTSGSVFGNSFALCSDGTLTAWGSNFSGKLGDGTNESSNVPIAVIRSGVLKEKHISSISAGSYHTLALISDAPYSGGVTFVEGASSTEGHGNTQNLNFTVTLLQSAAQPVTVTWATEDGTATAGSDYIASTGTLTFAPGETKKNITVLINGDTTIEPDETFKLKLSNPTNGSILTGEATGTIQDDDTPPRISKVSPNSGGNSGSITFNIEGVNLDPKATVKLTKSGQPDIAAAFVTAGEGRERLSALLDLAGKAPGIYSVVVTNPDGKSATAVNAFTIEVGLAHNIHLDIIGLDQIRPGRAATFTLVYENRGNTDAYLVPVYVGGIPKNATVEFGFSFQPPPNVAGQTPIDWNTIPVIAQGSTAQTVPLLIPVIPSGKTGTVSFTIRVPVSGNFSLRAWAERPWFVTNVASTTRLAQSPDFIGKGTVGQCGVGLATLIAEEVVEHFLLKKLTDYGECGKAGSDVVVSTYSTIIGIGIDAGIFGEREGLIWSPIQLLTSITRATLECVEASAKTIPAVSIATFIVQGIDKVLEAREIAEACNIDGEVIKAIETVISFDPNEKIGPTGFGPGHYLFGSQLLNYRILFENDPKKATAAAQEVVITDQLDATKVDFDTFELGAITFGPYRLTPPPGKSEWTGFVDLRPTTNLIVRVRAELNKTTGLVTWRFESLDPATGEFTTDPIAGFLPPNITPPEGDGSVSFSIKPKAGLPSGTKIKNKASIVFDTNAPIITNEWFNTIETSLPKSYVVPLPIWQPAKSFKVKWKGSDSPSGVQSYTIYVAVDKGKYEVWQRDTTATSATFTGEAGRKYSFYSVARDKVGNVEYKRPKVEAQTKIGSFDITGHTYVFKDKKKSALGDVLVTLRGSNKLVLTAKTDKSGLYKFAKQGPGTYTVTSSMPGTAFDPLKSTVIVLDVKPKALDFTTYEISGVIKTSKGQPVSNVKVQLFNTTTKKIVTQTTGLNGSYRFAGLGAGSYIMQPVSQNSQVFTPNQQNVTLANSTQSPNISVDFVGSGGSIIAASFIHVLPAG